VGNGESDLSDRVIAAILATNAILVILVCSCLITGGLPLSD
jgi:hypothetical protein